MAHQNYIEVDLLLLVRLAYIGLAFAVLLVSIVPPLRGRFLAYGPRTSSGTPSSTATASSREHKDKDNASPRGQGLLDTLLDCAAKLQVPHNWFMTFYVVSVVGSVYWAGELARKGLLFQFIAQNSREAAPAMSFTQLQAVWGLMLIQGSRRLYECIIFFRPSSSQMWVGHWALGLVFYSLTSVAVWIEGISTLRDQRYSKYDIAIAVPSLRSFIAVLIFILASRFQHDCHAYLASLKDSKPEAGETTAKTGHYRLPTHPAFQNLIAPHYTAECLIYLSLSLLAAPGNSLCNYTLLCALVFVIVNLGITAAMTKEWYSGRFGQAAVAGKWRMIPGLF